MACEEIQKKYGDDSISEKKIRKIYEKEGEKIMLYVDWTEEEFERLNECKNNPKKSVARKWGCVGRNKK